MGGPRTGKITSRAVYTAHALALTWLAAPWTARELSQATLGLLEGARRPQVGGLVHRALSAFVRAPHGQPDLLAAWLARSQVIRRWGVPEGGGGPRLDRVLPIVRRWPTAPARAEERSRPFDIALPTTTADLAKLLEFDGEALDRLADTRAMGRHASPRQSHYDFTWIPKRAGGARLLEAPRPRLARAQRAVLDRLLAQVPVHEAAHGFVKGRSIHGFVAPHVARPLVVRLDLEDFFGSVHAGRVRGVFRWLGCSDSVAHTLACLCTTSTPSRVLRRRPVDPEEPIAHLHRARTRLRGPHLPQGAPTSPALANLAAFRLDLRLAGLAMRLGARYTRYADDLAFSFDRAGRPKPWFTERVALIAREEGFTLASHKTRWMRPHQRQLLGGMVINVRAQVPRPDYELLRATLHRAGSLGLARVEVDVRPSMLRAHLRGRVAWVGSGSARRLRQLHAALAQMRA